MFTIKMPCDFGETCELSKEPLASVTWFIWVMFGGEYTYAFTESKKFSVVNLISKTDYEAKEYPIKYEIEEEYLNDGPLEMLGLPIKGTGYVMGLSKKGDSLYLDVLYTSQYNAHIQIEVNEKLKYVGGMVFVPPTWSDKKIRGVLTKEYKNIDVRRI